MKLSLRFAAAAAVLFVRAAYAQDPPPPPQPAPAPATQPAQPPQAAQSADAPATPPKEEPPKSGELRITPYATLVGGLKGDTYIEKTGEHKDPQIATIAVSRFGLRGSFGPLLSFESELMANGGVALHGTSAYEGQAALQVRQQIVRLTYKPWMVEVGRVIDEASVDFVSAHVQDTLLQDTATRDPLLYSGFNLGNGIRGTFEIVDGLRAGLTFNAGNPVSTTSSLMVGGSFPPFERFYTQPYQAVNQGPNNFPDDTFRILVLSPSMMLTSTYVDIRAEGQVFNVNTNTQSHDDDNINGYNLRITMRGKFLHDMLVPFANAAATVNDTVLPTNVAVRSPDRYKARMVGGGLDFNYQRRFSCAHDCADGVGAQYEQIQYQTGGGPVTGLRFINVGTTYWLVDRLALGARFALWTQEKDFEETVGERSATVTVKAVF